MRPGYFDYSKADWKKFSEKCDQALEGEGTIDEWINSLCEILLHKAYECIPIKKKPLQKEVSRGGIKSVTRQLEVGIGHIEH